MATWTHYDDSPGAETFFACEPMESPESAEADSVVFPEADAWERASTYFGYLVLGVAVPVFGWYAYRAGSEYWLTMLKGLFGI